MNDNYNENLELRNKQFVASKDFSKHNDEELDEEENAQEERRTIVGGGDLIFNRKKDNVKLQDFAIKKMVGKGTFGKVFLVENQKD